MYKPVCYSNIGKRLNQEDNFFISGYCVASTLKRKMLNNRYFSDTISSNVCLFAVSDGMGGHNAGEVASRICVEILALEYEKMQYYSSLKDVVSYLQTVLVKINETVCDLSRKQDELKGMGATLVLFVVCEKEYAVLNIGDSRAYHFVNNTLIQISKDNTEGQRMLDLSLLTREELLRFPACKNLNRYIGFNQINYVLQADEYYPILEGGIMILCSDGISDFVSDTRIAEILGREKNLEIAGKQLIDEAVASQNADNATIMLIPLT